MNEIETEARSHCAICGRVGPSLPLIAIDLTQRCCGDYVDWISSKSGTLRTLRRERREVTNGRDE